MNYLTALASSPVYEFPYAGSQLQTTPYYNNDIDAILSSITPAVTDIVPYQHPAVTLHCVPQINPSVGSNAIVYHVSEHVPIETVLQQFGIDMGTLQPSNSLNNYYRSSSIPMDVTIYPSQNRRRRRLVCHEVSDSEDDDFYRRPVQRHHHRQDQRQRHHSGPSQSQQSPPAIHGLLDKVWDKVRNSPDRLAPSTSAPSLNWQSGQNRPPSPPPPNPNTNNAWQSMRNAPPIPQTDRNAVNNVWNRAAGASERNSNNLSNMFSRMRQPSGGIVHSPPPMSNREAVHDFYALRNLPPGINQPRPPPPVPPPNREATNNFFAARNLPFGINQPMPPPMPPPQNREALNDFLAARHLPLGSNQPPPPQSQAAAGNFFAARNLPPGINQPPVQNQEALKNFFAARNAPGAINQPNPAVANVWNRADYAANYPPPPPPMNNPWNHMPPAPPYQPQSSFSSPAYGGPLRAPNSVPAPASFAALLGQSHRQHSPYAGSL